MNGEGVHLTPTEWACIKRASAGASRGEIAAELDMSKETVKAHLSSVYRKTQTSGAREAGRALDLLPPLDRPPPRRGITRHGALPDLPPSPIADVPVGRSSSASQADRVQEARATFTPFPLDQSLSLQETSNATYRPLERTVLILLIAVLILTAINYRGALAEAGRDAAALVQSIYR